MRHWGNLEGCISGELLTRQMWREINRITLEHIQKPENMKVIMDYVFEERPIFRHITRTRTQDTCTGTGKK